MVGSNLRGAGFDSCYLKTFFMRTCHFKNVQCRRTYEKEEHWATLAVLPRAITGLSLAMEFGGNNRFKHFLGRQVSWHLVFKTILSRVLELIRVRLNLFQDLAGISNTAVVERVMAEYLDKRKVNRHHPACLVIDGKTLSCLNNGELFSTETLLTSWPGLESFRAKCQKDWAKTMEMVYDESWFQRFSSRSTCGKGPEFKYPNYLFENGHTLIYFANLKLLIITC